jgi:hypothetical protein
MNRQLFEKPEREMYNYPGLVERGKIPTAQPVQQEEVTAKPKKEKKEPVAVGTKSLNLKKK